ncbi:hypothetical protein BOTBODRAFT_76217, partial [Botryobasidium botryosum FD-172 SS1]
PIDNGMSKEELLAIECELLQSLNTLDIYPCSQSSDGTEVERCLQCSLGGLTPESFDFTIKNSIPGCTISLSAPVFHSVPMVPVQDSKHVLKTARNQVLSGACFLTIGDYTIRYAQLRDIIEDSDRPLFQRDVEGVDRQDDLAAARLFSATTLAFILKKHSEHPSLASYLFVFGDMVDGWQNRYINHIVQIRMVLRTCFFLMAWRAHVLAHLEYSLEVQFISRESFDIFTFICDSLILLILVYRNHFPQYPLLPWLHSTKPCEHVFGCMQKLKADFNIADVLYFIPKLMLHLSGKFGELSPEQKVNATAASYHHTYFDIHNLDIPALMTWPTDAEIEVASFAVAAQEAEQLLTVLGI